MLNDLFSVTGALYVVVMTQFFGPSSQCQHLPENGSFDPTRRFYLIGIASLGKERNLHSRMLSDIVWEVPGCLAIQLPTIVYTPVVLLQG
jgi:hypothetical protein